ncbi:hypothetical protein ABIF63_000113 [Bradyrhizobium japonicum]|uniref:Uncharacterized protein n=1 Tax=Bradyrhizobium japonicum TaxID=375 RepID=A0ABV2RHD1_BRAJP
MRIVSLNTSEGWSRDASEDIAEELQRRCAECGEVPPSLDGFLKAHGRGRYPAYALLASRSTDSHDAESKLGH